MIISEKHLHVNYILLMEHKMDLWSPPSPLFPLFLQEILTVQKLFPGNQTKK